MLYIWWVRFKNIEDITLKTREVVVLMKTLHIRLFCCIPCHHKPTVWYVVCGGAVSIIFFRQSAGVHIVFVRTITNSSDDFSNSFHDFFSQIFLSLPVKKGIIKKILTYSLHRKTNSPILQLRNLKCYKKCLHKKRLKLFFKVINKK